MDKRTRRGYKLKHRYGITLDEYDEMLAGQNYQCSICCSPAQPDKHLCVDHCHVDGHVRGLLCSPCNLALGKLGDTPEVAARAAEYLLRTRKV